MTAAANLLVFTWTKSSLNVLFEYVKENYLKRLDVSNILNIASLKKCHYLLYLYILSQPRKEDIRTGVKIIENLHV